MNINEIIVIEKSTRKGPDISENGKKINKKH